MNHILLIILIILVGLIFFIINYKIININSNTKTNINETYINFSKDINGIDNSNNLDNVNDYEYNKLADDVKKELNDLYGLTDNELLFNHNERAKKYMLV
jgi:capsular polysaccharide biosynthesis protein